MEILPGDFKINAGRTGRREEDRWLGGFVLVQVFGEVIIFLLNILISSRELTDLILGEE